MISIGAASSQRENGVPTKDCPHVRIHQFTGPVVIELLTKRYIDGGMSAQDAAYAARRQFMKTQGSIEHSPDGMPKPCSGG